MRQQREATQPRAAFKSDRDGAALVIVAQRGRLALAVSLELAEVLSEGFVDRDAGADHPGKTALGRLDEDAAEPGLGSALCEVAGR
jgi:hypothetical protein